MAQPDAVILCLTAGGEALARRIAPGVGGEVHGRAGRTDTAIAFDETTAHVAMLFAAGTPIIGICAAGILIRSVAPLLSDKRIEPPVIAVSEDGSSVVPLLGGHRGANDLAARISDVLGAHAAVTTASDLVHGVALDSPPPGWRIRNAQALGAVTAALLAGDEMRLQGHCPHLEPLARLPNVNFDPEASRALGQAGATLCAVGSDGLPEPDCQIGYEPTNVALGVGCARGCPPEELIGLVQTTLRSAGIAPEAIAGVFSLDLKADEAAMIELAATLRVPFRLFDADRLEAETHRLANPSDIVFAEVGCHGVAEASALAAAGDEAELIVEKQKTAQATCALARAPEPIVELKGRRRGVVSLIGIGPGRADWRTPEASRLIAQADELVGYGFYIDLLGPLGRNKPRADFPLGGEEDRCRYALEEAAKGRDIAVICSGDAGIYAMGALVYELMAREENGVSDAARRIDVVTAPGISALQAAAARIGAPLGHDFCAISLSDLLTPTEDIRRRVRAAAEGDFVIAFYNPVSMRRRALFPEAIDVLRGHRPGATPVILARSLGRDDETIETVRLNEVHVDQVDMMTVVLVGSSQSRTVSVGGRARVFTPRGYAARIEKKAAS
ncbi:MAG: precorrin-3B C(17)-methyltransferase [Pseudomonadota bacterium]